MTYFVVIQKQTYLFLVTVFHKSISDKMVANHQAITGAKTYLKMLLPRRDWKKTAESRCNKLFVVIDGSESGLIIGSKFEPFLLR